MPTMADSAPTARVGRYELIEQLGRGSMGLVWLARDPNVGRRLALKVMAPLDLVGGEKAREELRQRFLQEARAAGRLSHPGIVMVLDADTDPATGSPYIAMELVEGRSLERLLDASGRLPVVRAVEMAAEVARALAYAHGEGVIHRDIKPGNILVSDKGPLKVTDFGIAKLASQSLTLTGSVMGSPVYMSPEQVRGDAVDARSDLFSLGSVLYRAVTGALPFAGDSIATVTFKVVNIDHRGVRDHVAEMPASVEALIDRALAKDPEQRFQDGIEMASALEEVARELRGEQPAPVPEASPAVQTDRSVGEQEATRSPSGTGTVILREPPPPPGAPTRKEAPAARWWTAGKIAWSAVAAAAAVLLVAGLMAIFGETGRRSAEGTATPTESSTAAPAQDLAEAPAAPPVEAPPLAPTPAPTPARLHLVYENRLASGTMTVWLDGEQLWTDQIVGSRNLFKRAAGQELSHTLDIPPGDRTVEVRITGRVAKIRVDAADVVRLRFEEDGDRWLRVSLNPLTDNLKLSWIAR